MAVRVGNIDLTALRNVHTEDTRNVVQLRGPGQEGSITHDLGREPVTIILEGELFGDTALAKLETLRQAQQRAQPMSFAAEAVAGSDLTEVVIAEFRVQEIAGFPNRFGFFMRVREHTEPPASAQAGGQAADRQARGDADERSRDRIAAKKALANPDSLAASIEARPGLLKEVSGSQLGGALTSGLKKGSLLASGISQIMSAVGKVNPAILGDVMDVLQGNGSITDLVTKLAGAGIDILSSLTGVDLGAAKHLLEAVSGGSEFLGKAQQVAQHGQAVIELLTGFNPLDVYDPEQSEGKTAALGAVTVAITALVTALGDLLQTRSVQAVVSLAQDLGIGSAVSGVLSVVRNAVNLAADFIAQKLTAVVRVAPLIPVILHGIHDVAAQMDSFTFEEDSAVADPGSATSSSELLAAAGKILGVCDRVIASLPTQAELLALSQSVTGVATTLKALEDSLGPSVLGQLANSAGAAGTQRTAAQAKGLS